MEKYLTNIGIENHVESKYDNRIVPEIKNIIRDEMNKKGAKIVVSNSDPKNTNEGDEFFDNIYSNHRIKRVEATRMINSNSQGRGKIRELLISNF